MSNKLQLQTNNINLASYTDRVNALIDTANALPSAGNSGITLPILSYPATASHILSGKEAIDGNGNKITGTIAFQTAKTITPSTLSQTAISSGYYASGSVIVASVPTQSKTITPNNTTQNVTPDSGKFLSKVTVKGDSNLTASNIKSGVSIFGVSGTYEGSSSGSGTGNTDIEDDIVTGNLTTYENSRVTSIKNHAFYSCSSLTSVSFPKCTSIGTGAFEYCSSLTTVSFPVCTNIGGYAFYSCRGLTSVNFPNCTTIGDSTFAHCYSLTTVSFPQCTSIGSSAFYYCSSLTSVSFPQCTSISRGAFYSCTSLTTVSFPECTSISIYAFAYCSKLTTANFPVCTSIGYSAFVKCSKLTTASFPKCTNIVSDAFRYCSKLSEIYLLASSVCTLVNSNAFSYTSITSSTGSIYVRSSLVTSYKAATNWTYFSNRIFGYTHIQGGDVY